jgi:hypothetical protein
VLRWARSWSVLTGDPNPEVMIRAVNNAGIYRFLRKPRDVVTLRDLRGEFPYLAARMREEDASSLFDEMACEGKAGEGETRG